MNQKKYSEKSILKSSPDLNFMLLNAMPDAVIIVDEDGEIVFANNTFYNLFGYSPEELLGQSIELLMPKRFREQHVSNRKSFIAGRNFRSMGHGIELIAQNSEGKEFPVEISLGTIETEQGLFNIAYVVDISIRKEAEKQALENEKLRAELEKDKRIAKAIEEFIFGITRSLHNPLSTINVSLHIMGKMGAKSDTTFHQNIKRIKKQVECIQDLLQDSLVVGRSAFDNHELDARPIDLEMFCEMCVASTSFSDDGQHKVTFSSKGNLQNALADTSVLRRIILNLLSNATKYSPVGSEVKLNVSREGQDAVFQIIDYGIGIPEESQSNIFKPLFRAANAEHLDGTGLGLFIVKSSVEQHGGTIDYESSENSGTKFTIRLPLFKYSDKAIAEIHANHSQQGLR